jgi:hypothetical protein
MRVLSISVLSFYIELYNKSIIERMDKHMLMDIKCTAVASVAVHLTFDDHSTKDRLLANGDLVDVTYNANGLQKHIIGRVTRISCVGTDPKGWYMIVDGSDDFSGRVARFSPASILDCEVLRKADSIRVVRTPVGAEGVPFLRIMKGRLQYSVDGFNWVPIRIDDKDIIEDQSGTVPIPPTGDTRPEEPTTDDSDTGIEDAVY